MSEASDITIIPKCRVEKKLLGNVLKAGFNGVELYLSKDILKGISILIPLCKSFPLRYFVHAPKEGFNPEKLASLVKGINAEVVIFHNVYWEDEWDTIIKVFRNIKTKLCIENTYSIHEPLKFMRRYHIGRCLDLEHFQMECSGVFEEEFMRVIKDAIHIHLTGYKYGTQLWHTHIHHSPSHGLYMLNLLKKAGYSGFVVSEAKPSLQTYEEFRQLNDFYNMWKLKEH